MEYLVVVEKGPTSYGAYVPDLPGCVAAADTKGEVLTLIKEAIEFHLEGLKEDGHRFLRRHRQLKSLRSRPHNRAMERIALKRADARFFAPVQRGR